MLDAINTTCAFCSIDATRHILTNDKAYAIYDSYPVSPGHSLIIPKRHISSFFNATREEQIALFDLVNEMHRVLINERSPDGFNVGIKTSVKLQAKQFSSVQGIPGGWPGAVIDKLFHIIHLDATEKALAVNESLFVLP